MKILAIETSAQCCGVSVSVDEAWYTVETSEPFQHDAQLATFTAESLAKANVTMGDIEVVAVSAGPGSFTGLRIGATFAKGLCFGVSRETSIPILPVSTLQSLAIGALVTPDIQNHMAKESGHCRMVALIDSHRDLAYYQAFDVNAEPLTKCELLSAVDIGKLVVDGDVVIGPNVGGIYNKYLQIQQGSELVLRTAQFYLKKNSDRLIHADEFIPEYKQEFVVR